MKKVEVEFTSTERRILGIPQSKKQFGRDAQALRKLIDLFPWLLEAADQNFSTIVCDAIIYREGLKIQGNLTVDMAIKAYQESKK